MTASQRRDDLTDGELSGSHLIRVQYIEGLLAAHGEWSPQGEVTIRVGEEALAAIRTGEEVHFAPFNVQAEKRLREIDWKTTYWRFNDRGAGTLSIEVPEPGYETECLEAVAIWIDEKAQPRIKGYFED